MIATLSATDADAGDSFSYAITNDPSGYFEVFDNAGTWEVEILNDGWTAVTKDKNLSAHFEHTVAITSNGPVILTKY